MEKKVRGVDMEVEGKLRYFNSEGLNEKEDRQRSMLRVRFYEQLKAGNIKTKVVKY
jgi:hypothetical protein